MIELRIPPERDLPSDRLARRREHLIRELVRARRETPRRSRLAVAGGLAAAAAAGVAVFAGVGTNGAETASAASRVLREAAATARTQPAPPRPGRGEYLYVKTVNAYLSTTVLNEETSFSVLVPRVRETWIGPNGGRIRETSGAPTFLTDRDREAWIAAGRPRLREPAWQGRVGPQEPLDLPADPDALFVRLERAAAGHSEGVRQQMFTLVGDALRETNATPEQRAALYEVAARIPGVELVGPVRDRAGRPGVAVAMANPADGVRHTLIFDPATAALLGEEQLALPGNQFGYPAGEAIGYATYFGWELVDSPRERPSDGGTGL